MDLSAVMFNTVLYIQDYIKIILLVTSVLNYKYVKSWKPLAAGIVFTVIYNLSVGRLTDDLSAGIFYLLYYTSVVILCALSLEGKKRLLYSIAAFIAMCVFDDSIALAVSKISNIPKAEFDNGSMKQCVVMSITVLIYYLVAKVFHELNRRSKNNTIDIKNSGSLYAVLFVCGMLTVAGLIGNKSNAYIIIGVILVVFLGIIIYNSAMKQYYKNINYMNEKIMTAQKEHYEHLLELESETRKFRHDIKNHMLCIGSLIDSRDYDAASQYIRDMNEILSSISRKYVTGNNLVNAIVNDIAVKYENVMLEWQGLIPEALTVSNVDICTIFSNLLDNAFCAASKCSAGKVNVSIKTITNNLMVTINNNIAEPVRMKNKKFITSKMDKKNHGIGTMNVNECVNSYSGSIEYNFTDKDFTVDVILPNVIHT